MQALVVAIASLLATHPATNQAPLSFGAPPLSEAELASAAATGNDGPPVLAPGIAPSLTLDLNGRLASSSIVTLVSDTGAQSITQQDTVLNLQVTPADYVECRGSRVAARSVGGSTNGLGFPFVRRRQGKGSI